MQLAILLEDSLLKVFVQIAYIIIGDLRTAQFVSILAIVTGFIVMMYRKRTTSAAIWILQSRKNRPSNR